MADQPSFLELNKSINLLNEEITRRRFMTLKVITLVVKLRDIFIASELGKEHPELVAMIKELDMNPDQDMTGINKDIESMERQREILLRRLAAV